MIGFTVPVVIYSGDEDLTHTKALLTLDVDSDAPGLDARLEGEDAVVINCSVDDAYAAVLEVQTQLSQWKRDHPTEVQS